MYVLKFYAWLERNGVFAMDEALAAILRAWEREGSLARASRAAGVELGQARALVRHAGEALGGPLLRAGKSPPRLTLAASRALREFESRNGALHVHLAGGQRSPILSVDAVVPYRSSIVLVRRRHPPYQGHLVLPGGIVEYGERVEEAIVREVREETGLRTAVDHLVGVYSNPKRDPRGHNVSTLFSVRVVGGRLKAGDDAEGVELHPLDRLPRLGFDHAQMVREYMASRPTRGR